MAKDEVVEIEGLGYRFKYLLDRIGLTLCDSRNEIIFKIIEMKVEQHNKDIITVKNFWSNEKCDEFIIKSEEIGYQQAMIQTNFGQRVVKGVRNNQRVIFTDENLAQEIWSSLKTFAPSKIGNSEAIGLNEMFRFYKYESGQQFRKHRDQSYIRNQTEASYFTFMIYLNEGFEGGDTTFDDVVIRPKKGSALIFLHSLKHEGSMLISGKKYVLRTDIMYKLKSAA